MNRDLVVFGQYIVRSRRRLQGPDDFHHECIRFGDASMTVAFHPPLYSYADAVAQGSLLQQTGRHTGRGVLWSHETRVLVRKVTYV